MNDQRRSQTPPEKILRGLYHSVPKGQTTSVQLCTDLLIGENLRYWSDDNSGAMLSETQIRYDVLALE